MFDLITGKARHMPSGGAANVLLSSVFHLIVLGVIVIAPMLFVTDIIPPAAPMMMAFIATPPPTPPSPPSPPPPRSNDAAPKAVTSNANAAPVEAPSRIEPEAAGTGGRRQDNDWRRRRRVRWHRWRDRGRSCGAPAPAPAPTSTSTPATTSPGTGSHRWRGPPANIAATRRTNLPGCGSACSPGGNRDPRGDH
jgi:hypothetical protein